MQADLAAWRLLDVLTGIGFVGSNKEAKRKIAEGAVKIDGDVVLDAAYIVHAHEGTTSKAQSWEEENTGLITVLADRQSLIPIA